MEEGPSVGKAADGDRCGAANPVSKATRTYSTGTAGPHITRYPTWLLLWVWGSGWGEEGSTQRGSDMQDPPRPSLNCTAAMGREGRGPCTPLLPPPRDRNPEGREGGNEIS